ncbi:MAG: hypothetical protein ACLUVC_02395 [Longibaculum sp.]
MKKLLCAMLCLGMMLGCSNKTDDSTEQKEEKEEVKEKTDQEKYQDVLNKYKHKESGTYQVGKDIEAGNYVLFADTLGQLNSEFSVRKTEFDEGEVEIWETGFINYYIKLLKGDFIELDHCYLYNIEEAPTPYLDNVAGSFKVGRDIEAGNYIVKPAGENTYFSVYEELSSDKERNTVITNGIDFSTNKKVKLKKGQCILTQNCTLEKQ